MEERKKRQKATRELAERLDFVLAEMDRLKNCEDDASEARHMDIPKEYADLTTSYNWLDEVFEENGKKGMKNVKGEIVVPAIYDDFSLPEPYFLKSYEVGAVKDGKMALVKRDGTGTPVTDFEYHDLFRIPFSAVYIVCKSEDLKHSALMVCGKVFTPYEIESVSEVSNGLAAVYANDKKGLLVIDPDLIYISPQYDDIYGDGAGEDITFVKDGKEGRVTFDKRFVSNEEYENMTEEEQDHLMDIGFIYEAEI